MRLALQIWLYVPLLLGYWSVHYDLAMWVQWIPDLFSQRPFRISGMLVGTLVCGLIAGAIFAVPTAFLYQRHAVKFAASVAILAAGFDAFHGRFFGHLFWSNVALALDLIFCAASLPTLTWALMRVRPNNSFKPRPLRGSA